MKELQRIFIIPDLHCPYHDKKAWTLALRARLEFKPHHTVILGDFADFYSVSSHSKNAARRITLEEEVDEVKDQLDRLDQWKDKRHFIAGNHEQRLERYINDRCPELFGLVSIPELFGLKERGWSYTPYGDFLRLGKLHLTHDEGSSGSTAHMKALATFGSNVVIGHCHSMGVHYSGTTSGKTHVGASFGWLGDLRDIGYMSRVKAGKWTHGFGIGFMEPGTGVVHLQAVPIVNGRCVVNGKLLVAR